MKKAGAEPGSGAGFDGPPAIRTAAANRRPGDSAVVPSRSRSLTSRRMRGGFGYASGSRA